MVTVLGTVLGAALVLAGCGLVGTSSAAGTTTTAGAAVTTSTAMTGAVTPVTELLPGQCANDLPATAQRPYAVLVLGCEQAHTYEIYDELTTDIAGTTRGSPYPGETPMRTSAEQQCLGRFAGWMGKAWTASDYDVQTWWPSEISWTTKSDRTVICAVYAVSGVRTVGSVRGRKL